MLVLFKGFDKNSELKYDISGGHYNYDEDTELYLGSQYDPKTGQENVVWGGIKGFGKGIVETLVNICISAGDTGGQGGSGIRLAYNYETGPMIVKSPSPLEELKTLGKEITPIGSAQRTYGRFAYAQGWSDYPLGALEGLEGLGKTAGLILMGQGGYSYLKGRMAVPVPEFSPKSAFQYQLLKQQLALGEIGVSPSSASFFLEKNGVVFGSTKGTLLEEANLGFAKGFLRNSEYGNLAQKTIFSETYQECLRLDDLARYDPPTWRIILNREYLVDPYSTSIEAMHEAMHDFQLGKYGMSGEDFPRLLARSYTIKLLREYPDAYPVMSGSVIGRLQIYRAYGIKIPPFSTIGLASGDLPVPKEMPPLPNADEIIRYYRLK